MGTLTASNLRNESAGSELKVCGTFAFGSSYNNTGNNDTTGETITAKSLGMTAIRRLKMQDKSGYGFQVLYSASGTESPYSVPAVRVKVYTDGVSAFTPGGSNSAPVFTGLPLANHTHTLSVSQDSVVSVTAGTGVSAALASPPIASVDNIYIVAGGVTGPAVIVPTGSVASSKQVSINYTTGVLQFLVADAVTSAKVTYTLATANVASGGTPAGSVSAPIFTGTPVPGAVASEVPNGTDLSSALPNVQFEAYGD